MYCIRYFILVETIIWQDHGIFVLIFVSLKKGTVVMYIASEKCVDNMNTVAYFHKDCDH